MKNEPIDLDKIVSMTTPNGTEVTRGLGSWICGAVRFDNIEAIALIETGCWIPVYRKEPRTWEGEYEIPLGMSCAGTPGGTIPVGTKAVIKWTATEVVE